MQTAILSLTASTIAMLTTAGALAPSNQGADVLGAAQALGQRLRNEGFVYPRTGLKPGSRTIDCTQFVLKVVEALIPNLPEKASQRITLADVSAGDAAGDKNRIVSGGDLRTRGVQQALIDLKRGEAVPLAEAGKGDLVQYWMQEANGTWFGHAGVIERIDESAGERRAWLFGSHLSEGGIGTAPAVGLRLIESADRRIYIVRLR